MSARTIARRLERLETKINPTAKPRLTVIVVAAGEPEAEINPTVKPGITVIVERAGEPKSFHLPDPNDFVPSDRNTSEGSRLDD
jgi:hypothetical protein